MQVFPIDNNMTTATEILELLANYQMLPKLLRCRIIDRAIASIDLTEQQQQSAIEQFHQRHQLTAEAQRQAFALRYGMKLEQLNILAMRELKIELFKTASWGAKLESYFLTHKSKLDKVVYSLLRTKNLEVARELYFRISAGEQSFAELAQEYSEGSEVQTCGLVGPVELSVPHRDLAKLLSISQPGQIWTPRRLGEWFVVVRLEKFISAVLDEAMRQRLLDRLFETWLEKQVSQEIKNWGVGKGESQEVAIHPTTPASLISV